MGLSPYAAPLVGHEMWRSTFRQFHNVNYGSIAEPLFDKFNFKEFADVMKNAFDRSFLWHFCVSV